MWLLTFQTEVREAIITSNDSEEAVFQNSNSEQTSYNSAVSKNAIEEPSCSQRNYSNPQVVITNFYWQQQHTLA